MENMKYFSPASSPLDLHTQGAGSSKKPILGGILIAITALFLAGWLYFCFTRKLCPNFKQKGKVDGKEMELRRFRIEELEKATDNFSRACLIGTGSFAKVYRGTFHVEGTLAIKKPHNETYTTLEEFRNEVGLLSKVKHENLVGLVGFCEGTGPKAAKILVYEYVTNGSLLDYIIGKGGRSLTWRDRVKIAIGAAKGIEHLHERSIIHRDLKPSNILVGEGFEAKVSDFGLVRTGPVGDQSHVSSQIKGTPGYLDPAYCSTFHLTPFTDVYSFGVILLQLLTARPAVEYSNPSRTSNSNSHIIDWARVSIEEGSIGDILDPNLLVEGCNMKVMLKMGEISLRCVVKVPKERPTMAQVCRELEAAFHHDSLPEHTPPCNQWERRESHSFVSVDGIGLQRFHVDMDSVSFQSASLRCLETSINMD